MDDPRKILKQEDMETPRRPHDLCKWVEERLSELAGSKESRIYARSGVRLPKKLMEELRPLCLFASQRFKSEDVTCVPNLGNENFDAQILFADPSKAPIYVELTYAKDGYEERLRVDVLNERGSVNAIGKVSAVGTKAARNQHVEVENEAFDHGSIVNAALSLLKNRLRGKSGKKYGPQHVLVIVVDDYIAFRSEKDKAVLRDCAIAQTIDLSMDFGAIYLLGASGRLLELIRGEI